MTVVDRWHKSSSDPADYCKAHGVKGLNKSEHGIGKRWQVRWYDDLGNPQKRNCDTKREADTFWTDTTKALNDGVYIGAEKANTTFADYCALRLEAVSGDENTRASYERNLRRHILPVLGHHSLTTLMRSPTLIQKWVSNDRRAPISLHNDFYLISSILRWAVIEGYIGVNPCRAGIRLPKLEDTKVIPLSGPQVRDMASEIGGIFVELAIATGMRQGELFGISPGDFDFERNIIWIRRQVKRITSVRQYVFALPKGRKERSVPLPTTLRTKLKDYLSTTEIPVVSLPWKSLEGKRTSVPLLIHSPEGAHWNSMSFNDRTWKPALRAVGLPVESHYGCHVLRHTFASILLSRGVDIRTLASYLGHTNPAFTLRIYTHMLPNTHVKATSAIDDLLGGW